MVRDNERPAPRFWCCMSPENCAARLLHLQRLQLAQVVTVVRRGTKGWTKFCGSMTPFGCWLPSAIVPIGAKLLEWYMFNFCGLDKLGKSYLLTQGGHFNLQLQVNYTKETSASKAAVGPHLICVASEALDFKSVRVATKTGGSSSECWGRQGGQLNILRIQLSLLLWNLKKTVRCDIPSPSALWVDTPKALHISNERRRGDNPMLTAVADALGQVGRREPHGRVNPATRPPTNLAVVFLRSVVRTAISMAMPSEFGRSNTGGLGA
ncbi:hypothetical protein C8R46DRAFT_1040796 [Mycena filopes]|nr:hypothetical protein C8R46DRAFT_1040796 [Mycena filopes]